VFELHEHGKLSPLIYLYAPPSLPMESAWVLADITTILTCR
jgi:hypothetical protein